MFSTLNMSKPQKQKITKLGSISFLPDGKAIFFEWKFDNDYCPKTIIPQYDNADCFIGGYTPDELLNIYISNRIRVGKIASFKDRINRRITNIRDQTGIKSKVEYIFR